MKERVWERIGAAAGIAFVVLYVVGGFIEPSEPHIDASTARIVSWVISHRHAILAGQVLAVLATVAFVWFVGHLRHVLNRAEGGAEASSAVVVVSGATLAAIVAAGSMPFAVLGLMAGIPEGLQAGPTVRALYDLNQVIDGVDTMLFAPFMLAIGFAMVRKELVATWLGWLSIIAALFALVGGAGGITHATNSSAWSGLLTAGEILPLLVVLIASVSMVWRPEVERSVPHPPAFDSRASAQ